MAFLSLPGSHGIIHCERTGRNLSLLQKGMALPGTRFTSSEAVLKAPRPAFEYERPTLIDMAL